MAQEATVIATWHRKPPSLPRGTWSHYHCHVAQGATINATINAQHEQVDQGKPRKGGDGGLIDCRSWPRQKPMFVLCVCVCVRQSCFFFFRQSVYINLANPGTKKYLMMPLHILHMAEQGESIVIFFMATFFINTKTLTLNKLVQTRECTFPSTRQCLDAHGLFTLVRSSVMNM